MVNLHTQTTLRGQAVVLSQSVEQALKDDILNNYSLTAQGELIAKAGGSLYAGPLPYVSITLDGAERPELKDFAPTKASSELLDRFYHVSDTQQQSTDILLEAVKLYNDFSFRKRADDQLAKLNAIQDKNSADYLKAKQDYDALVDNIGNGLLKPKST